MVLSQAGGGHGDGHEAGEAIGVLNTAPAKSSVGLALTLPRVQWWTATLAASNAGASKLDSLPRRSARVAGVQVFDAGANCSSRRCRQRRTGRPARRSRSQGVSIIGEVQAHHERDHELLERGGAPWASWRG